MEAIKIFYAYALPDEPLRKELEKHLTILKLQGLITTWHSQEITAGTERKHEIDVHLKQADMILLLVGQLPSCVALRSPFVVANRTDTARNGVGGGCA
jgi:hypothetical protein